MTQIESKGVLIVGAGPVGLAAAIALSLRNVAVRIIEMRSAPSTYSKAIGINARTLELLEPSGVTARLLKLGLKIPGVEFQHPDGSSFGIEFANVRHRYNFMLGLPQSETERVLESRLSELGVHVERNTRLERLQHNARAVTAWLTSEDRAETVDADFVIGADGAHSTVREQLNIRFEGQRMPGDWSLADVRLDASLPKNRASIRFGDDGLLFALSFSPGVFRIASDRPNVIARLPEDVVVHEVMWESNFVVNHRVAETLAVGRVALAGDAAHVHSPLGARGMNLGIEDAMALVDAIRDNRLSEYSTARRGVSRAVVRMVRAQTRLATARNPLLKLARRYVAPMLLGVDSIHRAVASRMLGLGY